MNKMTKLCLMAILSAVTYQPMAFADYYSSHPYESPTSSPSYQERYNAYQNRQDMMDESSNMKQATNRNNRINQDNRNKMRQNRQMLNQIFDSNQTNYRSQSNRYPQYQTSNPQYYQEMPHHQSYEINDPHEHTLPYYYSNPQDTRTTPNSWYNQSHFDQSNMNTTGAPTTKQNVQRY